MYRVLPPILFGSLMLLIFVLNTIFWGLLVFLVAIPKIVVPHAGWRRWVQGGVDFFCMCWSVNCARLARALLPTDWDVRGADQLDRKHTYLAAANHQTWNDLVAMQVAFEPNVPPYRLFVKQVIIWFPIIGQALWAMDTAFMRRYTREEVAQKPARAGRDLRVAQAIFERNAGREITVFNFVEGTRLTPEKHAKQNSPYKHLLKPRAGGVAFAIQAMGHQLDYIIDTTFVYPGGPVGLWGLLCGRVRKVIADVRLLPVPQQFIGMDYQGDPNIQTAFRAWVDELWAAKDARIEALLASA